jgi:hypothetical protein
MTAPATKRAWRNRNAGLPADWQRTADLWPQWWQVSA